MSSIEGVIKRQQDVHYRICRTVDNLKKIGKERMTRIALDTRIHALDALWDKFQNTHFSLISSQTEEIKSLSYYKDDFYADCEEAYFSAKTELVQIRDSLPAAAYGDHESSLDASTSSISRASARALPKILLPKFSGDYLSWPSFRDLFQSMIVSNSELPPVEKLHYFKGHVSGEAAQVIVNFSLTTRNFSRAWDALVSRYENKRVLVSAYLDRLFSLTKLQSKSADGLKTLWATFKQALGGLESLGAPVDAWDYVIVHLVTRMLDADSREAWEMQLGHTTEPASFQQLEAFIEGRNRALEMLSSRSVGTIQRETKPVGKRPMPARVVTARTLTCSCCQAPHYISSCPKFASKSLEARRELVTTKKLCFNCLGPHKLSECRSSKRCRVCNGQHHTLIHAPFGSVSSTVASASSSDHATAKASPTATAYPSHTRSHHASSSSGFSPQAPLTLLATAIVQVLDVHGRPLKARALMDQGSELSFISESLAQQLRLPRSHARIPVYGIGSQRAGSTKGVLSLILSSCIDATFEARVRAYILPHLLNSTPPITLHGTTWEHLQRLPLADPSYASPGRIDIILGADIYGHLLRGSIRQGSADQPTAQDSALGWLISGPTGCPAPTGSSALRANQISYRSLDIDLCDVLQRFWEQESVPSLLTSPLTADEEQCEAHFASTHSRTSSGRYVVCLPFRADAPALGDSHAAAAWMLARMQRQFQFDSSFAHAYAEFMTEYQALDHMTLSNSSAPREGIFFLPHHGVFRPSSSTSQLQVVFNGSLRTSTGISLNDCLHVGPKLQHDLADVILRWRRHAYVFIADIEKMYRQILVHPDDRNFQRILWSQSGPPAEFQLNTVTYGLACAPYLALRVLKQLSKDEASRFPSAVSILRNDMYVDDVLSGADSRIDAQQQASRLDDLLTAGGFQLRKWTSNDPDVLSLIAPNRRDSSSRTLRTDSVTRALGILWNPTADSFEFRFTLEPAPTPLTKRVVLSRVAKLFDPLGWIAPIIIIAEVFLQHLRKLGVEWDEPLPSSVARQWVTFEENLHAAPSIAVPRWLGITASSAALELHGFSDASQDALGAVVYLRIIHDLDDIRISLLIGKSKVAPLRKQTIPRLELSAAVLLVRLVTHTLKVLRFKSIPVHLWTDSSVALFWINGHPSRWKEFVANRVAFIRESAPTARWHHVAGEENPADCLSRGLSPAELTPHRLWWQGPTWLKLLSTAWPDRTPFPDESVNLERNKSTKVLTTVAMSSSSCSFISRYSSLTRLIRISAWITRVIKRFKNRAAVSASLVLSMVELSAATIPRLELSAAVLLVRLVTHTLKVLRFESIPVHLWTDSSVALFWINGHPSRWKEFVANRVAFIRESAPTARWHHVAGEENLADCLSRGLSPAELTPHRLWWQGPTWLKLPSTAWPDRTPFPDESVNLERNKSTKVLTTVAMSSSSCSFISRYSLLTRLIQISAWITRAIKRFKDRAAVSASLVLSMVELSAAKLLVIKATQRDYFQMEIDLLVRNRKLPRSTKLLRLDPFLDCEKILRIRGRLRNAHLDSKAKHPILLPREASFSTLILDDIHPRTLHGGVQVMLATLRQNYWILGGRSPVASFVRRCVRCARHRAETATQLMGQLPPSRVTPSRPFLHSGVDYAGPFYLKIWRGRSSKTYKGFLIVFVCFSTSAVHLKMATDYSAQGFIAAFKRLVGRRGICVSLTSDCGTNLMGADAELRKLFHEANSKFTSNHRYLSLSSTEWHFNPPSAPHFGDKWEAAVKSVKFHLRRLIGDISLTYEEFAILLAQIEAVLNSRPLCPLSDDPADLEALTPAHFLIGEPLSTIPEPSLSETPGNRLAQWQRSRQLLDRFWNRWSTEYLQRLQDISKWPHRRDQLSIGSLVLIKDERFPSSKWPLGRVVETHPGHDGLVRVATIRTAKSTFKRPIVKLCPLPVAA